MSHSRQEYNFIDLLGDVGGITNMMTILVGFFFFAMSDFEMIIDSFNHLFILDERDRFILFNQQMDEFEKPKVKQPFGSF